MPANRIGHCCPCEQGCSNLSRHGAWGLPLGRLSKCAAYPPTTAGWHDVPWSMRSHGGRTSPHGRLLEGSLGTQQPARIRCLSLEQTVSRGSSGKVTRAMRGVQEREEVQRGPQRRVKQKSMIEHDPKKSFSSSGPERCITGRFSRNVRHGPQHHHRQIRQA